VTRNAGFLFDCKEQGSVHTHRYVRVLVTQSIGQKDKFIVAVLAGNEYNLFFKVQPLPQINRRKTFDPTKLKQKSCASNTTSKQYRMGAYYATIRWIVMTWLGL